MMRIKLSCILRGLAFSALTNMVVPMAEAHGAEQVQVLRRAPDTAGAPALAFTTFQQEQSAITQMLPCKWISKEGRLGPSYGNARYDFLCKGGNFATVSLYLDKTGADRVGKVRLLYRDWNSNTNPNAGEARIAEQFLQHVAGRFVPAGISSDVTDGFWSMRDQSWSQGGVKIAFILEKGEQFNVRRLEISGLGDYAPPKAVPFVRGEAATTSGLTKAPEPETQVLIFDKDGKTITPTDAGLAKPVAKPKLTPTTPVNLNVLPSPAVNGGAARKDLVIPVTAPAGGNVSKSLVPATAAELNTAPAPESKVVPVAATEPSATLVPTTQDLKGTTNSGRAPSNFDIYNKASDLLKSIEDRAQISKVEEAKVTASKPAKPVSGTTTVGPDTVAPSLKPIPTPGQGDGASAPATPATTAGEGLGVAPKPVATPSVAETGQPENYNGPRRTESRPLPQLKFVPKAEPLKTPDEVLQFEDEKSRL